MPRRNRVTPFGELVADPARGLVYGNRGCLHDASGRIRRRYAVRRWIACRLEFRGWRRSPLLQAGKFTELFFLDEATAFAAGHRPCALCRSEDYRDFVTLWHKLHPRDAVGADELDARLHEERVEPGTRGAAPPRGGVGSAARRRLRRRARGAAARARRPAPSVDAGRIRRLPAAATLGSGDGADAAVARRSARRRLGRGRAAPARVCRKPHTRLRRTGPAPAGRRGLALPPEPVLQSQAPTCANMPGANMSERSISAVRPVRVSTSAWFASVVGGLFALRVTFARPLVACQLLVLPAGVLLLTLAVPLPVALIATAGFVTGIGFAFGDTLWMSTLQRKAPEHALSRDQLVRLARLGGPEPARLRADRAARRGGRDVGDARGRGSPQHGHVHRRRARAVGTRPAEGARCRRAVGVVRGIAHRVTKT